MWACLWETRVGTTIADVCLLDFSLLSILCYITCIHSHTCLHGDPSPFWDTHTSPLGLLLVWTFVLSIRRYWAGIAGDISGWGWHEQKLMIRSGQSSCHLLSDRADRQGDEVSLRAEWLYYTEWCIGERAAGVCIWLHCICPYIRFILSCCICDVFHSVFSVYVHLMYIFLSLFSVDGFYYAILLDIVLFCCCTPDNDAFSPSPDMERYDFVPVTLPNLSLTLVRAD